VGSQPLTKPILFVVRAETMGWRVLKCAGQFTGRYDHTATLIGKRIFVIGGITTTTAEFIGE
jgi:hypothetical protein